MTSRFLLELLEERWSDWFPGRPKQPLRLGFLASSAVQPPRGVVTVFEHVDPTPVVVVKVSLAETGNDALRREFQALEALWPERHRLDFNLPRPIDLITSDTGGYAVLSGVKGALLPSVGIGRKAGSHAARAVRRNLEAAVRVGDSLRTMATPSGRTPIVWAERVLEFARTFQLVGSQLQAIESFSDQLATSGITSAKHWQHGDLAAGNMLFQGTSIAVVDWEKASPCYPGWYDLMYAVLMLPFSAGVSRPRDQIAATLDVQGRVGQAVLSVLTPVWREDLPLRTAAALTAAEAALTSRALGRSGAERWADVMVALLLDSRVASQAPWVSSWSG